MHGMHMSFHVILLNWLRWLFCSKRTLVFVCLQELHNEIYSNLKVMKFVSEGLGILRVNRQSFRQIKGFTFFTVSEPKIKLSLKHDTSGPAYWFTCHTSVQLSAFNISQRSYLNVSSTLSSGRLSFISSSPMRYWCSRALYNCQSRWIFQARMSASLNPCRGTRRGQTLLSYWAHNIVNHNFQPALASQTFLAMAGHFNGKINFCSSVTEVLLKSKIVIWTHLGHKRSKVLSKRPNHLLPTRLLPQQVHAHQVGNLCIVHVNSSVRDHNANNSLHSTITTHRQSYWCF